MLLAGSVNRTYSDMLADVIHVIEVCTVLKRFLSNIVPMMDVSFLVKGFFKGFVLLDTKTWCIRCQGLIMPGC